MTKEIATPSRTREIMDKHHLSFKKSLGQNFMLDGNILNKMVDATEVTAEDGIIEVGAGIGALTEKFAKRAKKVVAFEIDRRFIPVLADTLSAYDNIDVRHQDILQADVQELFTTTFNDVRHVIAVGNLPYYVTTPILMGFLEQKLPIQSLTVMIQKEVGERLAAFPGTKAYGSLSIAAQYYAETEEIMTVPATVFMPRPNVDSTIIRFRIRNQPAVHVEDERLFFDLIRAAFAQRRKTLSNNLRHWLGQKEFEADLQEVFHLADMDGKRRAETLTLAEFAVLADVLSKKGL
ncbi:16S rRNA (adenine(1518)-N(6)/adenine(1519)-N(6))-dimethyltransferase RsmA [Salicibibacter kimchii]|uniref:Ribosomal RNA small subunit methyltransferase A n=1 Tax=Salicibibacter kimchii TaxID=2099786 RepID=A0A345C045_9BACI|nr:16S rRNA (adenine(1518)-N(6)/adenine(1519)-N(6))-dimethyltransferase RsmA [Salicibibacter kimchii]AXF56576.1 16S rRNA (adenine(1518)-N(6)/adenine(1519)-N(6))-dimethyltransferase RsmA [Salicibibacter kimchii]